jgi:hypothetical protein
MASFIPSIQIFFGLHRAKFIQSEFNNVEEVRQTAVKVERVLLGYMFKFLCSEHGEL